MAAGLLQEISQDERERARARSRKMYQMDMYSDRKTSELIGEMRANEKWQGVIAEKDNVIAYKDAAIIKNEAEIERLRLEIAELKALGDRR